MIKVLFDFSLIVLFAAIVVVAVFGALIVVFVVLDFLNEFLEEHNGKKW